ncbi:MAG: type II toxin-antitoxin system prevent-host-death family antitoxin [Planctomycetes bacterium]|nr:type II toxin-antitoxin system prevent-host-death family antitoxin [Planctomycetota bacterium]MCG2683563.1 type II toxin-antitoxin system prevent-host-death family antitoxin [Planctomycetales bacterium]
MTTLSATDARREFFELMKRATAGHRIYRIRHRKGSAVLMSEEDYESLLETLELLSIPGFRASMKRSAAQMKRGDTYSLEEVLGEEV